MVNQAAFYGLQVPVILVGNKVDLRGGEITNQDLENEIAPIMSEFKVYLLTPSTIIYSNLNCDEGSGNLCGMLRENPSKHF
jgi:hypothetical protein